MMLWLLWIIIAISVLAILFAAYTSAKILKQPEGTDKMKEISKAVHEGAMAFLHKEYRTLAIFMVVVTAVLYYLGYTDKLATGKEMAIAFVVGGFFSALAGNIGMRIATKSNARTAFAAKKSLNDGLKIAFHSGAVMGLTVVGLGLLGVTILYLIFKDPNIIFGFGFGASSIALFSRVGGGIFTKAADVGADLVGKIEAGIPEDDPRNPAVIADNVGDNVGDVAGMGADLFESYVGSVVATMALGVLMANATFQWTILPLVLITVGAGGLFIAASYFVVNWLLPGNLGVFWAILSGILVGMAIGLFSEHYTSGKTVKELAKSFQSGPATGIIAGLAVGMKSTVLPMLSICVALLISYHFVGLYGVAIAAVGMLGTIGIIMSVDAYGPIADNAGGICTMAGCSPEARKITDKLDSIGNTTAAIGKGFAIGSAALTALALFAAYTQTVGVSSIDLLEITVVVGFFIGALMPFVFSALTMQAVGRAASAMVEEVRYQFKNIAGLMEGTAKPNISRCVDIATSSAIKEMMVPGALAVIVPLVVGLILGPTALGGFLAGALGTGILLAIMMSNSGGAWDNAKKEIEDGYLGGKGTPVHAAAVVGDTIGDPFKDTSGPSINILLKLMSIVALVFGPVIAVYHPVIMSLFK